MSLDRRMVLRALVASAGAALAPGALAHVLPRRFPFTFVVDAKVLSDFRDTILVPGMIARCGLNWRAGGDFAVAVRLRQWARDWLDNGYWYGVSCRLTPRNYPNLQYIIAWREGGGDGQCGYYAQFYNYVCHAAGLSSRQVWWGDAHGGSDLATEVWIRELNKWVVMHPMFNCWVSDHECQPLSAWKMNELVHAGRVAEMVLQRDGSETEPGFARGVRSPEAVFNLAYDTTIFRSAGDGLAGDVMVYRYASAETWRYPTLAFRDRYVLDVVQTPLDLYMPPPSLG